MSDFRKPSGSDSRKPTAEDQLIGRQIKEARKKAGRNQDWLATELGITYQQLGKYERGESSLKVRMLAKAATLLGTSPGFFLAPIMQPGFAEEGAPYTAGAPNAQEEFDAHFRRLIELWPLLKGSGGS